LTLIIFYFIFLFLEGGRTKTRHLSSPLIGRCLDETDAEKKRKKNALICSHYALWSKKKKKESLFHNHKQTLLTKSPEHIQAVSLHCDSNLVKESALY
jgi:hypothetical protein